MIEVSRWDRHGDDWIIAELGAGKSVSLYCLDYRTLKKEMSDAFPMADVWYSERNGDGIALLVPNGTPETELPSHAQGYGIFEWIDPDKNFGTGYMVKEHAH